MAPNHDACRALCRELLVADSTIYWDRGAQPLALRRESDLKGKTLLRDWEAHLRQRPEAVKSPESLVEFLLERHGWLTDAGSREKFLSEFRPDAVMVVLGRFLNYPVAFTRRRLSRDKRQQEFERLLHACAALVDEMQQIMAVIPSSDDREDLSRAPQPNPSPATRDHDAHAVCDQIEDRALAALQAPLLTDNLKKVAYPTLLVPTMKCGQITRCVPGAGFWQTLQQLAQDPDMRRLPELVAVVFNIVGCRAAGLSWTQRSRDRIERKRVASLVVTVPHSPDAESDKRHLFPVPATTNNCKRLKGHTVAVTFAPPRVKGEWCELDARVMTFERGQPPAVAQPWTGAFPAEERAAAPVAHSGTAAQAHPSPGAPAAGWSLVGSNDLVGAPGRTWKQHAHDLAPPFQHDYAYEHRLRGIQLQTAALQQQQLLEQRQSAHQHQHHQPQQQQQHLQLLQSLPPEALMSASAWPSIPFAFTVVFESKSLGATIVHDDSTGHICIQAIKAGSAAFVKGVQSGDRILTIAGQPIGGLSLAEVVERIVHAPRPVTLGFSRRQH